MRPEDFKDSPAGRLAPTIQGCMAFVPHPLPPPNLNLGGLVVPLEKATHALGELSGIGRSLPNPHLLIRPFTRVEAMASSKIEGTVTTMEELLFFSWKRALIERTPGRTRRKSITTRTHWNTDFIGSRTYQFRRD